MRKRYKVKRKVLVIAVLILCGFCAAAGRCTGNSDGLITQIYTVQTGDTLWSIAEEYKEQNTDTRKYIRQMYELNPGLTADILPGDQIEIVLH